MTQPEQDPGYCQNCYSPSTRLTKVGGYLACADCAEAATGPLWARIAGNDTYGRHDFERGSYPHCMRCGLRKEEGDHHDGPGI